MFYCNSPGVVLFEWLVAAIRITNSNTILDFYCFRYRGACDNINDSQFPGDKGCDSKPGEIIANRGMSSLRVRSTKQKVWRLRFEVGGWAGSGFEFKIYNLFGPW